MKHTEIMNDSLWIYSRGYLEDKIHIDRFRSSALDWCRRMGLEMTGTETASSGERFEIYRNHFFACAIPAET